MGAASLGLLPAGAAPPPAQSTTAFCANTPNDFGGFNDTAGSRHQAAIECLAYSQVTRGKPDGRFAPRDVVTRGEMASFIARTIDAANLLEKIPLTDLPPTAPDHFRDDAGSAHEVNINRLASAGIVSGTDDGLYVPDEAVSRAQMATFINHAQRFLSGGLSFQSGEDYFSDDNGNLHEGSINGIAGAGVTQGITPTSYGPLLPVERANMASFIIRYLAVLHASGTIDALPPAAPPPPTPRLTAVAERVAFITIDDLIPGATANVHLGPDAAPFSGSSVVASTSVDGDPGEPGFQVQIGDLTPATAYEFYVTQSVDGEESPPLYTTARPETSLITTAEVAPSVTAAAVSGGRPGAQLLVDFSEPVTARPGAAPKVTVTCTKLVPSPIPVLPPTLETTFAGTGTGDPVQVAANTLHVTLDGTVPNDGSDCRAAVGAEAVQDSAGLTNNAQTNILVP